LAYCQQGLPCLPMPSALWVHLRVQVLFTTVEALALRLSQLVLGDSGFSFTWYMLAGVSVFTAVLAATLACTSVKFKPKAPCFCINSLADVQQR
jgi:hypothetical protein